MDRRKPAGLAIEEGLYPALILIGMMSHGLILPRVWNRPGRGSVNGM